jgi:hypothetical protein
MCARSGGREVTGDIRVDEEEDIEASREEE